MHLQSLRKRRGCIITQYTRSLILLLTICITAIVIIHIANITSTPGTTTSSKNEPSLSFNNNNPLLVRELHDAIKTQNVTKTTFLLQNNNATPDIINIEDEHGNTPLIEAVLTGNAQFVELLLSAGAQPVRHHRHTITTTPLHAACQAGHVELIPLLLSHGIDPNETLEGGWTALMGACWLQPGVDPARSALVVSVLLADGRVDPRMRNSDGYTAWDFCMRRDYKESMALLEEVLRERY